MTITEESDAREFMQKHPCKENDRSTMILTFKQTGIAEALRVTCGACGKGKNVTDYAAW